MSTIFLLFLFCVDDPRRPYPQDTEMRAGLLGKLSAGIAPANAQLGGVGG